MKKEESMSVFWKMGKLFSNHKAIILFAILTLLVTGIVGYKEYKAFNKLYFVVEMGTSTNGISQVFFDAGNGYNGNDSYTVQLQNKNIQKYIFLIPSNTGIKSIRLDPMDMAGEIRIKDARIENKQGDIIKKFSLDDFKPTYQISTMAIKEGILNNLELHFTNEPARHKLLDVVGDLALVGTRIKGHVIASRPGHNANTHFAKIIKHHIKAEMSQPAIPSYDLK